MVDTPSARLRRHLRHWLGRWPATSALDVVGSVGRERPGWDGRVRSLIGVATPDSMVLSVPPARADVVRSWSTGGDWHLLAARLPELLGQPGRNVYSGVVRWCEKPTDLPDVGVWVEADEPGVPDWLRPFGGQVLIAFDPRTGAYLAGVGLKRHDSFGRELAVGTQRRARGRGLARCLVAQAARRILDEGGVPTYQHDPGNIASARVADAAGFPDLGWHSIGMW